MNTDSAVTRRAFLKKSALGGVAMLAPGIFLEVAGAQEKQGANAADLKSTVVLENDLLRIEVGSNSGNIVGLTNKRSGKDYIAAKEWSRAFRLNMPVPGRVTGFNADYYANALDSWNQTKCSVSKDGDGDTQILKVHYSSLTSEAGTFDVDFGYAIRLAKGSDEAILQCEVANHAQHRIKEVFFPWISGIKNVENQTKDFFVAPNVIKAGADLKRHYYENSGNWEEYAYLLKIPNWPNGYSLSLPWMNYGGKQEGIYLASKAREGRRHMLMIQDFGDGDDPILGFAWAFPAYIEPGTSWQSPEIVLSTHEGDWHAGADKYRATLEGWYEKPVTEPGFKRAFASFNSFYTKRDFNQIVELAEDIRKYDLNHLVMWNFGDYYPAVLDQDDLSVDPPRLGQFTPQWGGLQRLQDANKSAQSLGVTTGIIFSQRLWNKDTLTPELRQKAEKWGIRTDAGDLHEESWDHQHLGAAQWSNEALYYGHKDYVMCSGVEEFRDFATHNIRTVLSQAGYSLMFYDQAVENMPCFSTEHHHGDPSGSCIGTLGFIRRLKEGMRQDNPKAILMGEGWEVLSSQVLDAGWCWSAPTNPEVYRYSLPWAIPAVAVQMDRAVANRYFVLGVHLALVAQGIENGKKLSDFPQFAQHIARLADLHKKTERFWTDGTFQDDIGLRVSQAFGKIYKTHDEVAVILANLKETTLTSSFELDSEHYKITNTAYTQTSTSGDGEEGSATKDGRLFKASVPLAPHEVAAVIFKQQIHTA